MNAIRRTIISAPFGNYHWLMPFKNVTYTVGTFTWDSRGTGDEPYGSKWWRIATTTRYSTVLQGWRNRNGLKNHGILSYKRFVDSLHRKYTAPPFVHSGGQIVSILGTSDIEWNNLIDTVELISPLAMEMNVSGYEVLMAPVAASVFKRAVSSSVPVIVKIPPISYAEVVNTAYESGVRIFHVCNSLPSPLGGISGKPLLSISQNIISLMLRRYPDITVIGGGGIMCLEDAQGYRAIGAKHVALGSMLLNPRNWLKVSGICKSMDWPGYDIID